MGWGSVVDDGARGRSSTDNGGNYISAAVGCQTSLWKFTTAKVQCSVSSHIYMGGVLERASRCEV